MIIPAFDPSSLGIQEGVVFHSALYSLQSCLHLAAVRLLTKPMLVVSLSAYTTYTINYTKYALMFSVFQPFVSIQRKRKADLMQGRSIIPSANHLWL